MYYVYVIQREDGRLYIGYSSNLKERIEAHKQGKGNWTKRHKWELVYYEAYKAKDDAKKREQQLKKSGQARRWLKERIANSIALSEES